MADTSSLTNKAIKNDLFELSNTSMVFGDAKKVLGDLLSELKDLGLGKK